MSNNSNPTTTAMGIANRALRRALNSTTSLGSRTSPNPARGPKRKKSILDSMREMQDAYYRNEYRKAINRINSKNKSNGKSSGKLKGK